MNEIAQKLQAPFDPGKIEWRVQTFIQGKWALLVPYIDARAVQKRLDEVFGPFGWECLFEPWGQNGVICTIRILNDQGFWVRKQDGADNTAIEATKGGLSDALKRAAVQWGIGRYLYNLGEQFVNIQEKAKGMKKGQDYDAEGYDKETKKKYVYRLPTIPREYLPKLTPAETEATVKSAMASAPPKPQTQEKPPADDYVELVRSFLRGQCGCRTKADADAVIQYVVQIEAEDGTLRPKFVAAAEVLESQDFSEEVLGVLKKMDNPAGILEFLKTQVNC